MKQWIKRTPSPENSNIRSTSRSRQFRQIITKLTQGYPQGHFLAYCIASKESNHGIFLTDRLFALDTLAKQLRYYSHIPKLPLSNAKQLPAPKEIIKIKSGVQFNVEKVRIGHAMIKWEHLRQKHYWKIIMGSNQICRQFHDLFEQVMIADSIDQQQTISEEYKITNRLVMPEPLKEQIVKVPSLEKNASSSHITPLIHAQLRPQQKSPVPNQNNLAQQSTIVRQQNSAKIQSFEQNNSQVKLNISLRESQRGNEDAERFFNSKFKILEIQSASEGNTLTKNSYMLADWIYGSIEEKAAAYNRFVERCIHRVELIMQNFMTSHLMHEEYMDLHLIRDSEIELYYLPIIDSTDDDETSANLFRKMEQEQNMLEEWQCLNYLSCFKKVGQVNIVVPMICAITFKGFKFFCKYSQKSLNKTRIYPSQFSEEINLLQKLTHLQIRNGKQQIFHFQQEGGATLYFSRLSCMPKVATITPVTLRYIKLFITEGVISNHKDIHAISEHIHGKLVRKIKQNLKQKTITSSCELMDYITDSGLSYHYLPLFLPTEKGYKYDYIERLIGSEIVACAMEWQIRRRMQIQLFRKRQFGFATNQIRIVVNFLFQEDRYFIKILQNIIESLFHFAFLNIVPLKDVIEHEAVLISLFSKLGFDCNASCLHFEKLDSIWSQKYVNDYIQLIPAVKCKFLKFELFSAQSKVLKEDLVGQSNNQLNLLTNLERVLSILKINKHTNGLYSVSNQYSILSEELRRKTNYFLSHFIAPTHQITTKPSLQSLIYNNYNPNNYYTHSLQYLTTLNNIRWLARMKYHERLEPFIDSEIEKGIVWNQLHYLVQIYSFYAKLKFKQGQINIGLEHSLKALQYSLLQYDKQPTVFIELLIAEQAFQAANLHFECHHFTKALDLYSTVEDILQKTIILDKTTLNPEFLELYVNKCSISLLFGQYNQSLEQCEAGLKACQKFTKANPSGNITKYQFKIYNILFRCYQIKNMRKQLVQISNICAQKYLEDAVFSKQEVSIPIFEEVLKMMWISIIKQVESIPTRLSNDLTAKLRIIYFKKIKAELIALKVENSGLFRLEKTQVVVYIGRRMLKHQSDATKKQSSWKDSGLEMEMISSLASVSLNSRKLEGGKLLEKNPVENDWIMLEGMTVLMGYNFMIGAIDQYLRNYDYQS